MFGWIRRMFGGGGTEAAQQQTRIEPPVRAPTRSSASKSDSALPQKDAWEGYYMGRESDLKVSVEAEIRYIDGEGQRSTRRIGIQRFAPEGKDDFLLFAYCYGREQTRTFKASRIERFVTLETGEIVSDIGRYLLDAYGTSSAGRTSKLLAQAADELAVLVYVARADEKMGSKEKAFLVDYLGGLEPGLVLDNSLVNDAIATPPSRGKLTKVMKALRDSGRAEALLPLVDRLQSTRTKADPMTDAAATVVRDGLLPKKKAPTTPRKRKAKDSSNTVPQTQET